MRWTRGSQDGVDTDGQRQSLQTATEAAGRKRRGDANSVGGQVALCVMLVTFSALQVAAELVQRPEGRQAELREDSTLHSAAA
jgi:hypothetical protein